jgi:UDP-glucose 4-epimerase
VIETARDVTGCTIEAVEERRRPGDPPILIAASDKIRAQLGWSPQKPELGAIIADAWQWLERRVATSA